jgi:tryptophanase
LEERKTCGKISGFAQADFSRGIMHRFHQKIIVDSTGFVENYYYNAEEEKDYLCAG